jgi:lysophospholipase L1-like esterase
VIVFFFGDSITQGFWDDEGGWAARVRRYFDTKHLSDKTNRYISFFNLGIDGDTTDDIVARFDTEVKARLYEGEEYIFIFAVGTNDTIFRKGENLNEPDKYVQALDDLYSQAQKYSDKILFIGLTPVQDELLNPMPWSKSGKCYSTERMQLFDNALRAFCKQSDTTYIDVWADFELKGLNSLMHDGVHPNSLGHQIISKKVIQALDI